jgi:uncharacterized protein
MQIQLKELAQKGQEQHLILDMDLKAPFAGRKDILHYSPIHADLHASLDAGRLRVNGTLTVDVELSCSRCLSHVKQTIELPFEEVFAQKPVDENGQEMDEDIHLVTEDNIELEPYVIENVVIGLPYSILCDKACKGLCPTCGVNRNETSCTCVREKIDPRLAGLADFFNKE